MHSASFYEDEEEAVQETSKKTSGNKSDDIVMGITVVFSVILAVGLFMLLPFWLSDLLGKYIRNASLIAILEGLFRIVIFVGYIVAISLMKDIRRLYMYHGAEHKCINCIDNNADKHNKKQETSSTTLMLTRTAYDIFDIKWPSSLDTINTFMFCAMVHI